MSGLGWKESLMLTIALALVLGGLVAVIVAAVRAIRRPVEPIYPAQYAVGRDVYRDVRGLTK